MITRALRQFDHNRDSQTQKTRWLQSRPYCGTAMQGAELMVQSRNLGL